jgi:serine/threonine protein kinase
LIGFSLNYSGASQVALATEFVPNGDLSAALKCERKGQAPQLNATQKSKVIFGVTAGMAFLHGRGILHHNLNPANILLNEQFEPVIHNFGVSRYFDGGLYLTEAIGTPSFLSPEMAYGDGTYDFAVDVYSFAVTLYSIFADPQMLDDGGSNSPASLGLIMRVCDGARFVRVEEIPDAQWEVIHSCWAEDPKARPTFQSLLDSFRGGRRYVIEGSDRAAILEYEDRVYGQFGLPNTDKQTF